MRPLRIAALFVALLVACGAPTDRPPTRDGGDLDARPDVGAECISDAQCDDRVACTTDRCAQGRCAHEPAAARCPEGSVCDVIRACLPRRPCAADDDCVDPCTTNGRCAPGRYCLFDALENDLPCGDGRVCRGGACTCPTTRSTRCGDRCVDTRTDPDHCGACGVACGAGAWCSEGRCACSTPQVWCPRVGCTDITLDNTSCGACGNPCPLPGTCEGGRCVQPCAPGFHRCADVCVSDSSPLTCGTRCMPCLEPMNGSASCTGAGPGASCSISCAPTFHPCGTVCASNSDPATCGDRCSPCPPIENGSSACVMSACQITCRSGYHRCGMRCVADDSAEGCGALCTPCPVPMNAVAACVERRCAFTCEAGFRRCGDICSDGTSPLGCGPDCVRCRVPDNGAATCTAGACGFRCNPEHHACGDACASNDSPLTCGSRCMPCPAPDNARATCREGACGFECDDGFARDGDRCRELPRLRWPPSGSFVTSRRPTFRWTLPPGSPAESTLQLCRDRRCEMVLRSVTVSTTSARVTDDLPVGLLYWRVRSSVNTNAWPVYVSGRAEPDAMSPSAPWGDNPDFDADGYADIVVGAPLLGLPGARIYVLRGTVGGTSPMGRQFINDPSPSPSTLPSTQFGWSLAASDFDADGYTDAAVGAPGARNNTGIVYVFHGGSSGLGLVATTVLTGPDGERGYFGFALTAAGDVNADGYNDLAIGAYGARNGRVYVHHGGARGVSMTAALTLDGPMVTNSRYGQSLAGAGDIDGDGDSDLLVAAPEAAVGAGRVYVHLGSPTGLAREPVATLSDIMGGRLGTALNGVGDLNGDGYPDIAIGAPAVDNGTGRVHVYHGASAGIAATPTRTLIGPTGMESDFGTAIVGAGDTNGDGYGDMLVSSPRVDMYTGRAYVFRGGAMGVAAMHAQNLFDTMAGPRALFGGALGAARDVDRDGFCDAVVTAERASIFVGQVTILRGSAEGLGAPTVLTGPDGPGNRFGVSVARRASAPHPSSLVCSTPRRRSSTATLSSR